MPHALHVKNKLQEHLFSNSLLEVIVGTHLQGNILFPFSLVAIKTYTHKPIPMLPFYITSDL